MWAYHWVTLEGMRRTLLTLPFRVMTILFSPALPTTSSTVANMSIALMMPSPNSCTDRRQLFNPGDTEFESPAKLPRHAESSGKFLI